jgi:hypothetical protein
MSNSAFSPVIQAPIEKVDIAGWLSISRRPNTAVAIRLILVSCGTTSTDNGKAMSINVEMIGKTRMIQYHAEEIATAPLCRIFHH